MGLVRTLSQTTRRASLGTTGTGEAQSAKRRGEDDVERRGGEARRELVQRETGLADA